MNNKVELKPCPFCGGEAKETNVFGRIGISCEECGVMLRSEEICRETGYGSLYQTWNHRTPAPLDDQRLTEIFGKPVSFLPECIYQNSNLGPVTCKDTENENSGKPCSKRCKTPTPYSSTDKRLTEIQARTDKATGEPWDIQNKQAYSMPILCDNRGYYVAWINNAEFANTDADGDFMAHARQDIPYLMKDNAQLRSALSAARAEVESDATMTECWLVHPIGDDDCSKCPSLDDCQEVRAVIDNLRRMMSDLTDQLTTAEERIKTFEAYFKKKVQAGDMSQMFVTEFGIPYKTAQKWVNEPKE